MHRLWMTLCVAIALVLVSVGSASAAQADEFILRSHTGGGARPPLYGLRLDGLYSGNTNDIFTFDFDHATADMRLTVTGSTIVISGTAYGGLNEGSGYASGADASKVGVWQIYFEYDTNVSAVSNGWHVTGEAASNAGTIQRIADASGTALTTADTVFAMTDEQGSHSYSFQFIDAVHRSDGPWSGWGWVNHDTTGDGVIDNHIYASDWLFSATPVPEPGTLALLGLGVLCVGLARRRRLA